MKIRDRDSINLIAVVAPREKGDDYNKIMPIVIRAIDRVEYTSPGKPFCFLHNGITSGSLAHVMEAVNKIQAPLANRGRSISMKKMPLDIEMYGHSSETRWINESLEMKPELMLVVDDGKPLAKSAIRSAKDKGVPVLTIEIAPPKIKERLYGV